jgi:hypothetical protein
MQELVPQNEELELELEGTRIVSRSGSDPPAKNWNWDCDLYLVGRCWCASIMNISWFFGGKRAVYLARKLVRWDEELEFELSGTRRVFRVGAGAMA